MPQEFTNPYLGLDESQLVRFQTYINKDHHQFFWRIRAKNGTFTTFINILVAKLHDELNRRNIVDITDTEAFEHFVANSVLTLPENEQLTKYTGTVDVVTLHGGTVGGLNHQTTTSNVDGRTPSKRSKNSKPKTK